MITPYWEDQESEAREEYCEAAALRLSALAFPAA